MVASICAGIPAQLPHRSRFLAEIGAVPGTSCPETVSATIPLFFPEVEMETEVLFTVDEAPEGGYLARAFGHGIFVQVDTLNELHAQVRDAVACHFDPADKPRLIRLHFVRDEVLAA